MVSDAPKSVSEIRGTSPLVVTRPWRDDLISPAPRPRGPARTPVPASPDRGGVLPRAALDGSAAVTPAGPLGNTAKSVRQKLPGTPAQDRRETRYRHQRAAAKLLPDSRTGLCLWAVASLAYGVDVINNVPEGRARFTGLQTCGSVWSCPCCSGTVSERRRVELNTLLAWARSQGYHPVMLTLTARHSKADDLGTLLDGMKKAKQRLARHRAFADLRSSLVGYVTATEVTGGGFNGWHPHFHQVMLLRAADQAAALDQVETLRSAWLTSLRAEGLDGAGAAFQAQGASAAGNYVAKWGAAEELALSGQKKGREGRNPFQLLADYSDNNDTRAGALFAEFAKVFKGRRQLVWSPGLKKLAAIEEMSDEQAAEDAVRLADESKHDERVGHFTPKEWKGVRKYRAALLKFAEVGGAAGLATMAQMAAGRSPLPWRRRGVGVVDPDGSEAEATAVDEAQAIDAGCGAGKPPDATARPGKHGCSDFEPKRALAPV